ncbi:hypothetical protein KJ841_02145 [Patescibacteria group bacterium]|nr:hypothetical protein [Patescibacteria group bacterium]
MDFLKKLQNKSLHTRKLILWSVVIILGLILAVLWINSSYKKIQKLKSQNVIEELNLPNLEMPVINE